MCPCLGCCLTLRPPNGMKCRFICRTGIGASPEMVLCELRPEGPEATAAPDNRRRGGKARGSFSHRSKAANKKIAAQHR